jgi:hypothetical protein
LFAPSRYSFCSFLFRTHHGPSRCLNVLLLLDGTVCFRKTGQVLFFYFFLLFKFLLVYYCFFLFFFLGGFYCTVEELSDS